MAIAPPKIVSCLTGEHSYGCSFLPRKPVQSPLLSRKNGFRGVKTAKESMASVINDLNKEEQQEKEEKHMARNENENSNERRLADCWREILGQDNWAGMLDPIDPLLRAELIRYGEMAQACYDAFDFDTFSKYCGSCRFNRRSFFESLGLQSVGYEVTRYVYATSNVNLPNFFKKSRSPTTSWSRNANWIGFVAVSDDETSARLGRRDITIAWRGTVTQLEWIADLMIFLQSISEHKTIPCPDPLVKVESGFLDLYTDKDENCRFCKYSAREQISTEIRKLIQQYPNEDLSITVTGHSLGSALAILSAYDIVETKQNLTEDGRAVPVCVFSFSGPRVGNVRFKERLESLGVKSLRVVNVHDAVPKVPGLFFNEQVPKLVQKIAEGLPWWYSHVGTELELDHRNSPFLKDDSNASNFHNLEALLHLLDGYHGKGKRFILSSKRDVALVNKSTDFLKDHHLVPPSWRQDQNKGMVRNHEGQWVLVERPNFDDHALT